MVIRKLLRRQELHAAILLLAFVPTLAFVGHWNDIFGSGQGETPATAAPATAASTPTLYDASAQQAEQEQHEQHCHTNLASCSEQPVPSGAGFMVTHDTHVFPPMLRFFARLSLSTAHLTGRVVSPLLLPPRAA